MSRRPGAHARRWGAALGLTLFAGIGGSVEGIADAAEPNEGEARELLRDSDAIGRVTGDPQAASLRWNPASMAFLKAFTTTLDLAVYTRPSGLRGSGAGLFAAIPLPYELITLGAGLQFIWRGLGPSDSALPASPEALALDAGYGKFHGGLGLNLSRWVPGLALGLAGSAAFSPTNYFADGAGTVDVGLDWRANRYFSMGLVGRALNAPRLGDSTGGLVLRRAPLVIDPELALRPFGDARLELGAGLRARPGGGGPELPDRNWALAPRAFISGGWGGVGVFAEVERGAYFAPGEVDPRDALRVSAGLHVRAPHLGVRAAPVLNAGGAPNPFGGVMAQLRIGAERFDPALEGRPRKVTLLKISKYGGDRGLARLIELIDELSERGAPALLFDLRDGGYSYAQGEELREALVRARDRGTRVVFYMRDASLKRYYLASAADYRILHPRGSLQTTGMKLRTLYYGELLGRIGVASEFIRRSEYKASAELYARSTASDPAKAQRDQLLSDVWNHVIRGVAADRGWDANKVVEWIDRSPLDPVEAQQEALIDAIAWPDELDERLEAWLGRAVRIESPSKRPVHAEAWGDPAHIAVLHIDGDIVTGNSAFIPILGRRLVGGKDTSKLVDELRKDPDVRAMVLRIRSRGGSVEASADIAHALDRFGEKKPIVATLSTAAGSGGYWIATAADYIYTNATSITGSIGVYYPKVDLSGLMELVGVGVDFTTIGQNAGLRSWFKPYSASEREAVEREVGGDYQQFLARVEQARALSGSELDAATRGRVFSGVRAIEVGLADDYGGFREAAIRARRMIRSGPSDLELVHYPEAPGLVQQLQAIFGLRLPNPLRGSDELRPELGAANRALEPLALWAPGLVEVLKALPAAFFAGSQAETLALAEQDLSIE